ncbi:hypothetical protein NUW58_g10894 [Xylaria curta]|uniref:Uncharacterized protein n=1 Tax=Xylaria curta TaxID=42375 RepID=A0ACC1MFF2_9PEZI|nr:hypothetical protein NUW58_g10894 [Xylaria curta]
MLNPEAVRQFVQLRVDPEQMKDSLRHFTSFAHLAGTEGDYALAMDVHNSFQKNNFDQVAVDEFYVYLNYPKKDGRVIEILSSDRKRALWSAKLEENEVGGETAGRQTYSFHGHSKAGDVQGPLIYANYGSRSDFKKLADKGIDTKGAIALVRYHGTQGNLALKVKAAEMAGFAGCIVYSDPADDGFIKGNPLRRDGWESKEENPRMKVDQTKGLVSIPSLPIAWRDAQVLLQHIEGFGDPCPGSWRGGVPDVKWWSGNASSPVVRLKNEQDDNEKQKIWNIYAKIEGVEQAQLRHRYHARGRARFW